MKALLPGIVLWLAQPTVAMAAAGTIADAIASTPEYDMSVRIDPQAHRMEVKGTVLLPPAEKPRSVLEFDLSEQMKDLHVEILQPEEAAGPVDAIRQEKKNPQDQFIRWQLHPGRPIAAGQRVRLRFSYGGGESIAFVFYIGPEGSFAGGANTAWYPQLEEVDGRGRGRVMFSVPAGLTVVATGKRLSAPAEEEKGNFIFESAFPGQFSFAAARYSVVRRDGPVPVRAYVMHSRENIKEYTEGSSRVLDVLTAEFGRYPYDDFAIAEVPSEQASQAGFSGASMNGFMLANKEALETPFNLAYYGHEIGHQWWGNVVTLSGDRGAFMLDEALAQFGSLRVVEKMEGTVAAEAYRRDGYPGYNPQQCGYGYLMVSGSAQDHSLADLPADVGHALADSKGFLVWDALSNVVGRERFSRVLRDIAEKYRFRGIRWEEFLTTVQKAASEDLSWFYSQWLERTGAPDWEIEWRQEGKTVRGAITQSEPLYRSRLEVEARGANGERFTQTVEVSNARTEFSWPVNFQVRSVVLDPRFHVLHWVPELRGRASARAPYDQAAALRDAGKLEEAETVLLKAMKEIPSPDAYGSAFYDEYGLARIAMEKKAWQDAGTHLENALAVPVRDRDLLPFAYFRYAQIAQAMHDDVKLHWAVEAAISADAVVPGGTVAAAMAKGLLAAETQTKP